MPQVQLRETRKLFLPSTASLPDEKDRFFVIVKKDLSFSGTVSLTSARDQGQAARIALAELIHDWNFFKDAEEKDKWPITPETVDEFISTDDSTFLMDELMPALDRAQESLTAGQKKTSTDTTTPSTTEEIQTPPIQSQPIIVTSS